jgi:hypothetical protein
VFRQLLQVKWLSAIGVWSGRRESNPHLKLGKLAFCH